MNGPFRVEPTAAGYLIVDHDGVTVVRTPLRDPEAKAQADWICGLMNAEKAVTP